MFHLQLAEPGPRCDTLGVYLCKEVQMLWKSTTQHLLDTNTLICQLANIVKTRLRKHDAEIAALKLRVAQLESQVNESA